MLSKSKSLQINELQPGMISAEDIFFEGKTLLAKGVAITESIISKLKENYILEKLNVYLEIDPDSMIAKTKTVKELEETFNEFSSNLEDIFNNLTTVQTVQTKDLESFLQRIQEEFKSTGLVIKNIVLHNSENDSIYRHSINTAAISFVLGKWLNLSNNELNCLTYSAILHDFGKMQINKDIINKKEPLSDKEQEIFKTHPVIGYHFIKEIPYIDSAIGLGVLMHHERMDGSGYPLHAKEDKIHKFAKIIAIADSFDKVNSKNYKNIKGPLDALKIIQDDSISKLDSNYCNVFLKHIINYYMGENVLLNNNQCYKIIQVHMNDLTRPLLLGDSDFLDLKKEKDLYVQKLVI